MKRSKRFLNISLKALAFLIFVTAVTILAEIIAAIPLPFLVKYFNINLVQTIYTAVTYGLASFAIIVGGQKLVKSWKTSRTELGLNGLPTWTDLFLAPVAFIIYILLAAAIVYLFTYFFPWFDSAETQDVGFSYLNSGFDKVLAFVSLCLLAPFFEELIFRGWLYGKLRNLIIFKKFKKHPKIRNLLEIAIPTLLVSLLFGIMHGQWNVGVNVFALSLALCTLREITGTIYAGIILHMIKNAIAFILLFVISY